MKRYWYFRNPSAIGDDDSVTGDSIMVPVDNITGFQAASDTTVDIYFKSQLSETGGVPGAIINDTVQLTVATAKRKEIMRALAEGFPTSDTMSLYEDGLDQFEIGLDG